MSWAEIKKAINSDFSTPLNALLTNSTYGLSALKSILDKLTWYATSGSNITLYSKNTATSVVFCDNATTLGTSIGSFIAPRNGVYRIIASTTYTNKSSSQWNNDYTRCFVQARSVSANYPLSSLTVGHGTLAPNAFATKMSTLDIFLRAGEACYIYCGYHCANGSGNASATLNGVHVKYNKTTMS